MLLLKRKWLSLLALITIASPAMAQTEFDAIMMNRKQLCNGFMYNYSSWDNYWEGTMKRTNENIGTISTQSVMYMGAYGITDDLNVLLGAPFVWTKASAGTLHGLNGVQDVSAFIKWKALKLAIAKDQKLNVFLVGGISTPLTDYVVDFLPLSIGLGSTNLTGRVMADYQNKWFSATGSAAYVHRSNVEIDRESYFDTEMHLTNEVNMPNAMQYQLRTGYRGKYLIAEALLSNWTTLGGFDITRNNMPFPSNKMNSTTVGTWLKYSLPSHSNLQFYGGANFTVAGRNVGQATSYNVGAFYAFYVGGKKNKTKSTNP